MASSGAHHGFASSLRPLLTSCDALRKHQDTFRTVQPCKCCCNGSNHLKPVVKLFVKHSISAFLLLSSLFFCDRRFWPFFVSSLNSGCLRSFAQSKKELKNALVRQHAAQPYASHMSGSYKLLLTVADFAVVNLVQRSPTVQCLALEHGQHL